MLINFRGYVQHNYAKIQNSVEVGHFHLHLIKFWGGGGGGGGGLLVMS